MHDCTATTRDISRRVKGRLHQHYLRWLARQPAERTCRSANCRSRRRTWRRRWSTFCNSRAGLCLLVCLAVAGGILMIGLAVAVLAGIVVIPPAVFFAAPEHHPFASQAERAAVALTRLTAMQTLAVAMLLLVTVIERAATGGLKRNFYRGRDLVPRHAWRIVLALIAACSAGVYLGAAAGQPHGLAAAAAALLLTGCLAWLSWGAARRLTAVRLPGKLSDAGVLTALLLIPALLLLPALGVLYNPVVLRISQYLDWLGPLGWLNGSILRFSQGDHGKLWPFLLVCAVMAVVGGILTRRTGTWAFRRQLLTAYRTEHLSRTRPLSAAGSGDTLSGDLRALLTGSDRWSWRAILWPDWLREKWFYSVLLWVTLLAVQVLFASLTMFLLHLEQSSGLAGGDALTGLHAELVALMAGWSLLAFEVLATCLRDAERFVTFARRPSTLGALWYDLQRSGLRATPMQLLFSIPFLLIPAWLSPELWRLSVVSLAAAVATCLGIRTAVAAAACYGTAIATLRPVAASAMNLLGVLMSLGLLAVSVGPLDGGATHMLARQLVLVPGSFIALGAAWVLWRVVDRPRRLLRWCW